MTGVGVVTYDLGLGWEKFSIDRGDRGLLILLANVM